MAEPTTREVVEALYAAYGAGDLEGMLGLMDEEVEVTFLAQGTFKGLPAFRRFIAFSAELLVELDWRLEKIIVEGETGCGIWEETARTLSGEPWHTTGVDVIRVRDGRIMSLRMNNDAALSRRHFPTYEDPGV
jgi:ketosteroid isomerase-like protein